MKTNMNASTNTNYDVRIVVILWVRNDSDVSFRFVTFGSFHSVTNIHIRTHAHTQNQTRTRIQSFWGPTAATLPLWVPHLPRFSPTTSPDVAAAASVSASAAVAASGVCVDRGWGCLHRASIPKTISQRFQFGFAYHAMMTAALIETKIHRELCVF